MANSRPDDVQNLLALAQDRSKSGRSMLVAAFTELCSGEERMLSAQDRSIISDIVRQLIKEVEMPVRRAVAERLSRAPDASRELILALANDTIDVAYPILIHSEMLQEDELIEIVLYRTMEHQVAIARRPHIGERVSDALVATKNEEVITTLISNDSARISEQTFEHVIDQSKEVESFQEPLVRRKDLSPQLVEKLYWSVSVALREHIATRFKVDIAALDDAIEGATLEVLSEEYDALKYAPRPASPIEDTSKIDEESLRHLVRQGMIQDFVHRFSALTRLRTPLIRRLLFETGGEGLALACKAIGISEPTYAEIFILFRQGRLGDKSVKEDELTEAMQFYEEVKKEDAEAILRTWRRNEGYLNAMQLVGQSKDK